MLKFLRLAILLLAFFCAPIISADARMGGGSSFGSRGTRSFSVPRSTQTAPGAASPLARPNSDYFGNRSSASPNQGVFRPGMRAAANNGLFGNLGRGFLGGLLGAGLFGLMFGHGFFGGFGGLVSIFGFMIQLVLVVLIVRWVWKKFSRHSSAQFSTPIDSPARGYGGEAQTSPMGASSMGASSMGVSSAGSSMRGANYNGSAPLAIESADYQVFEERLKTIEAAFSDENISVINSLATPDVTQKLQSDLNENVRRGVINKISNVTLVQGDLSESWREANAEYATVAMRFSLIDAFYDRQSHRLVSGSDSVPQQAVELWTFTRPLNGLPNQWRLSAIQQSS